MAGNSMQQYFPRVRDGTLNSLTCLILDGASKSAFLRLPKGKKRQGGRLMKGYVLSRKGCKMSGFFHIGCGFG